MKAYGAEFIGTFWLVLGGCGSAVLAGVFADLGIDLIGISLAFRTDRPASGSARRVAFPQNRSDPMSSRRSWARAACSI